MPSSCAVSHIAHVSRMRQVTCHRLLPTAHPLRPGDNRVPETGPAQTQGRLARRRAGPPSTSPLSATRDGRRHSRTAAARSRRIKCRRCGTELRRLASWQGNVCHSGSRLFLRIAIGLESIEPLHRPGSGCLLHNRIISTHLPERSLDGMTLGARL